MISHSNSPHRLHKDVAALQKFIFGIHSNFRVKICYSDTLVCLSSLWLGKELSQFHLEMGEYWNHHHSIVLFQDVLPQWRVCSLLFHIVDMIFAAIKKIFASFSCIFVGDSDFSTNNAVDLISSTRFPTDSFIACVAREAVEPLAIHLLTPARHSHTKLLC